MDKQSKSDQDSASQQTVASRKQMVDSRQYTIDGKQQNLESRHQTIDNRYVNKTKMSPKLKYGKKKMKFHNNNKKIIKNEMPKKLKCHKN